MLIAFRSEHAEAAQFGSLDRLVAIKVKPNIYRDPDFTCQVICKDVKLFDVPG